MAIITVSGVRGAPGATTTALAMTASWPRPVLLLEADPFGSSAVLSGLYRGQVAHDRGMLSVVVRGRGGSDLADALDSARLPLDGAPHASWVPTVSSATQSAALLESWPELIKPLRDYSTRQAVDVIVDAGRIDTAPDTLLDHSDRVLLVMRSDMPSLAAAKGQLPVLASLTADRLGLVVVGPRNPYSENEIAGLLAPAALAAALPLDPATAAVYSHGATAKRSFAASALRRAWHRLALGQAQWLEERGRTVQEAV